ncbi:hypothetical protein HA466_0223030 [Hirschfeldia incana]|nr:hypothetical protein HA466_0223030 [Hirschfeldia incana]
MKIWICFYVVPHVAIRHLKPRLACVEDRSYVGLCVCLRSLASAKLLGLCVCLRSLASAKLLEFFSLHQELLYWFDCFESTALNWFFMACGRFTLLHPSDQKSSSCKRNFVGERERGRLKMLQAARRGISSFSNLHRGFGSSSEIVRISSASVTGGEAECDGEILTWYKVLKKVTSRALYLSLKRRCEQKRSCAKRLLAFMSVSENLRQRCILFSEGKEFSSTYYFPKNLDQVCLDFANAYTPFFLASSFAVVGGCFTLLQYLYESREQEKKFDAVQNSHANLGEFVSEQGGLIKGLECLVHEGKEEAVVMVKKEVCLLKEELMKEIALGVLEWNKIVVAEDLKKKKEN